MDPSKPFPTTRFLQCPLCALALEQRGAFLVCERRHTFNRARQGYVNFLVGRASHPTGDTAEMVERRARFLDSGHFAPLAERIAARAAEVLRSFGRDRCVFEPGAGTGYYLARVLERSPEHEGIALDVSKDALKRAGRAHERIGAIAANAEQPLPIRSGVVALALSIFAPRNASELRRVLDPAGTVLVVIPTAEHLRELVAPLGLLKVDPAKTARLDERLRSRFVPAGEERLEYRLTLAADDAIDLIGMGPNAFHFTPAELAARIAPLGDTVRATASFELRRYRVTS